MFRVGRVTLLHERAILSTRSEDTSSPPMVRCRILMHRVRTLLSMLAQTRMLKRRFHIMDRARHVHGPLRRGLDFRGQGDRSLRYFGGGKIDGPSRLDRCSARTARCNLVSLFRHRKLSIELGSLGRVSKASRIAGRVS